MWCLCTPTGLEPTRKPWPSLSPLPSYTWNLFKWYTQIGSGRYGLSVYRNAFIGFCGQRFLNAVLHLITKCYVCVWIRLLPQRNEWPRERRHDWFYRSIGAPNLMYLMLRQQLELGSSGILSGKRLHNYGKSPCSMGKSTISMAIFNSFL